MRRRYKMDYWIYPEDYSSFRNRQGDLHRNFTQDPTSISSLSRPSLNRALRFAYKLARKHNKNMIVSQGKFKVRTLCGVKEYGSWPTGKEWVVYPWNI